MALTEIKQTDARIRHTLGSREDCTGWKALRVAVVSHMAVGGGSCTPRALTPCLMLSPPRGWRAPCHLHAPRLLGRPFSCSRCFQNTSGHDVMGSRGASGA